MDKRKNKSIGSAHKRMSIVLAITAFGLLNWYLKPKDVKDFKDLVHGYAEGIVVASDYSIGKNRRVHVYEFQVNGIKYQGEIGYLKINAEEGDSCIIIYELANPKRNTIQSIKPSESFF